jgi:DMSO/TMAO reductase YedYZ molybdopterin-dependent catalytic subunit
MGMKIMPILTILLLFLSACTAANTPSGIIANEQPVTPSITLQAPNCNLAPIIVPILPSKIPGYTSLDEATGLHMTGTVQSIDFASYRLQVTGSVEQPLSLQYDDLRCLAKVTASPKLVCPGFFEDTAEWSGVPIVEILKLAHLKPEASHVILISVDGYKVDLDLNTAMNPENFIAYELMGQPIPVIHGFPLRAVLPGKLGGEWVKWLGEINVK